MNYQAIERLLNLMNTSGLRELEIEEAGLKIRMSKNDSSKVIYYDENKVNNPVSLKKNSSKSMVITDSAHPVDFEMGHKVELKDEEITTEDKSFHDCFIVKSPMVGTYYSSATENGTPFVNIGDVVSKDSIVCIIEAMKLMNEIECEVDGKVAKIFVSNGEVVEFGEPIMAIQI
ncbi:MAG: acetyl-CoA carboxylase biotin carboxyl carrier protein [Peptostreptococcaceae bacterium]